MEIKKLGRLNSSSLRELGNNGYTTNKIYVVDRVEKDGILSFNIAIKDVEAPVKKNWQLDKDDIEDYNEIIDEKHSLSAFENNKFVGMLISEESDDITLFIEHLLILENQRKKGIGEKLVRKLMEYAVTKKFKYIELETENTNVAAIELFKKLNFRITGLNLKSGTLEVAVIMAIKL